MKEKEYKISFCLKDIVDQKGLYEKVLEETTSIWSSPKASRGRSFSDIWNSVFMGKVAEAWMVQEKGLKWTEERWHDLQDSDGTLIEIKTIGTITALDNTLRRMKSPSVKSWNKSKEVWVFLSDGNEWSYILNENL
jgi:hypothetical protein